MAHGQVKRVAGGLFDSFCVAGAFLFAIIFFTYGLSDGLTPTWPTRLACLVGGFIFTGIVTGISWEVGAVSERRKGRPTEDLPERPVYDGSVVDHGHVL